MQLKLQVKILLLIAMILILIMFVVVAKSDKHVNGDTTADVSSKKIETKVNNNDEKDSKTVAEENENKTTAKSNEKSSKEDKNLISDEELKKLYPIFDNSLFIGDSRTEGIKIYSGITSADFFCKKSLDIDMVLSGEKVNIEGKDQDLSEVLNNKYYSKVYICLGINELGWDKEEDFYEKYQQLIDKVKEVQTTAKIYVELIFPVNEKKIQEKNSAKDYVNNERIRIANGKLISLAKANRLVYLNPAKPLVDENGSLKEDATADGIHVNSDYCKQWAGYLAKITK